MNDERESTQDLIRRCLDGTASDAQAAEINRLVTADPSVARQLAEAARLESSLEVVTRDASGASGASILARPPAARQQRSARFIWVAAATITAAAAALALVWTLPGTKPPVADVAPARVAPADPATHIRFADGSTADLRDAHTRLETRSSRADAIELVLKAGGGRFEVVHREGRRFRIWVGATYVEVLGTIFTVDRLAAGVRVSVERGSVKVVSGQNEMRLSEGTAEVVPIEEPERAQQQPEQRSQKPAARAAVAATATTDEPGTLLHASEDARRKGRPQDALRYLQRLVDHHPRDPRAAYAAFILGRVLLEELHRPSEAAAAFARVEALDAKTPLAQDALAREVESWARAGSLDKARQSAGVYLARYPHGRRADEVRRHSRME